MRKALLSFTIFTMASMGYASAAQDSSADGLVVSGHDKTAYMATEARRERQYDGVYHFSPAVRAGDFVYASGVVGGAWRAEEPLDKEAFKNTVRNAFNSLQEILAAAGSDLNHVVKIQTFHVFDSPLVAISKNEQVRAVAEVKSEFIGEPHPAWTAVGTTALLPDAGLVEIDIVVYAPLDK